ncbi:MAG TPA: EamA family transporter [Candidatus Paceibacterota bacterium]|nr:EamA family transporter [Candidatus Paceibacterota bacterium]
MEKEIVYLVVLFCALLGALGQVFFKLGSKTFELSTNLIYNWQFLIGLFLYGIATLIFVTMLKYGNLSVLYPIIATSYIWVGLFSVLFLKESFPMFKWVGIFLIIAGVVIITR